MKEQYSICYDCHQRVQMAPYCAFQYSREMIISRGSSSYTLRGLSFSSRGEFGPLQNDLGLFVTRDHIDRFLALINKAVSIVGDQCIHRCSGKYCRSLCGADAAHPSGGSAAGLLARCKLPAGHEGPHECTINLGYAQKRRQINITVKKYSLSKRQRTDSDVASTNVAM